MRIAKVPAFDYARARQIIKERKRKRDMIKDMLQS